MADLLKPVAVFALAAFCAWGVNVWFSLFSNRDVGFVIGFCTLGLIAWLYDRRQAYLRRSNTAMTERD